MDIHVYLHADTVELKGRLDRIDAKLTALLQKEIAMSQQMDDLKAAVENENTVIDSAVTLLNGLSAQIAATAGDPAAAAALADEVKAKTAALAAAVTANTPTDVGGGPANP